MSYERILNDEENGLPACFSKIGVFQKNRRKTCRNGYAMRFYACQEKISDFFKEFALIVFKWHVPERKLKKYLYELYINKQIV